jgi:hypothetical protein
VRDRLEIEAASSSTSLGLLADDAYIAILHRIERKPASDRDRAALSNMQEVLAAVERISARSVSAPSHHRAMAPSALDETVHAVASARAPDQDVARTVAQMRTDIQMVLGGGNDEVALRRLRTFLDKLARITLARSEELARPSREHRPEWMTTVLPK